jgi:hypothetical protein
MALTDSYASLLTIVNEVQRKLALTPSAATTSNAHAKLLVDFVNDVVDDLADNGSWVGLRRTAAVSCVSGQVEYNLTISGSASTVQHVEDVRLSGRTAALEPFNSIQEFRQLTSISTVGTPIRYALVSVDNNGNPTIGLWPRPGGSQDDNAFYVHFYMKPRVYAAGTDDAEIVPFPARVIVQGVLALVILDESNGMETMQYKSYAGKYEAMKRQALNRLTADTGGTLQLTPMG